MVRKFKRESCGFGFGWWWLFSRTDACRVGRSVTDREDRMIGRGQCLFRGRKRVRGASRFFARAARLAAIGHERGDEAAPRQAASRACAMPRVTKRQSPRKCRERFRRVVSATSRVAAPSRRRGKAACAVRVEKQVGARREEREVDVRRTWRRVCASLWPMSNLGRAFLTWQRKNLVFGVTRHARFVWAISLTALSDEKPRATESALELGRDQRGSVRRRRFAARRVRVAFERWSAPVKFAGAGAERQVAWRSIACSTS